ncbi:amino acid permease family protein [Mycobacteroides abscessus]|nr:amino acid permease family protein [Mycobacteroides abscessus]
MYLSMVLSMAEMSSALPTAGGGYTFARRALGPWGGFATGTAILIEYAIAPAAIATFIGSYVESLHLPGLADGWWIYLAVYAVFIGIHLSGAGEALRTMFIITGVALVGLVIFTIGAVGRFDVHNLTNIPVDESARGASAFLPYGYLGIWAAVPFAIWLFLAIEGVPLAAEEAREPAKNIPRGILMAMLVLVITGTAVLLLVPGVGEPRKWGSRETLWWKRWVRPRSPRWSTTSGCPGSSPVSSRLSTPTAGRPSRCPGLDICRPDCRSPTVARRLCWR